MNLLDVDALQLYMGKPYKVNEYITILQPTVGQIADWGEERYFSMIHTLTAIPSDMKSQLWDMGIDYEKIADFDLFALLCQSLTVDRTSILFGDLDFSKLKPYKNPNGDGILLANKETGIIIDTLAYKLITNYLCKLHGLTKKVEHAANAMTKKILIEDDRQKLLANKNKPFKSFLLPLISSVKVRMGYTKDYICNEGYAEFQDDVTRLQIIHNADALLQGCYAGTIDMGKIKKSELNWMQEIK